MKRKKWILITVCLLLIFSVAFVIYHQHPSIPSSGPKPQPGQTLHDMIDTYGPPYESFWTIAVWKDPSYIMIGGFTNDNRLKQYGVFDLHHRYLYGNLSGESIGSIWSKAQAGHTAQLDHVYDIGSGVTINAAITASGVIIAWDDPSHFDIIDPLDAAYSFTPWPVYLLTHPISSWLSENPGSLPD